MTVAAYEKEKIMNNVFRRRLFTHFTFWLCAAFPAFGSGTVTNCTQSALETALAGGGTVLFGCSGTLTLTNTIKISNASLIDANGFAVVISGSNSFRLFQVASNLNFQINGLTLANGQVVGTNGINGTNGNAPTAGQSVFCAGILNQGGTLTLLNCILTNNNVLAGHAGTNTSSSSANGGDARGAAIYSTGGNINFTNCTLVGNAVIGGNGTPNANASSGSGGQALGGAIFLLGTTGSLQNVMLLNNRATGGATYAFGLANSGAGGDADGGAFYATNSTVFINSSLASSNRATGGGTINRSGIPVGGGGSGSGKGGCLFLAASSSAKIQLSSYTVNSASGGDGQHYQPAGGAMGGALFNGGKLQISSTSFSGNRSLGGDSILTGVGAGGAVYSTNTLAITACTLDNNVAMGGSVGGDAIGGIPAGAGNGGGLWSSGFLTITNSTCTANVAKGGAGNSSHATDGPGGDAAGGALLVASGSAVLVNTTIAANEVVGGAGHIISPPGAAQGGAIYNTNGTVICYNSIFSGSTNGNVWGTLTDQGHNICSDNTANFSAAGSLNSTDPLLSPLSFNGGPTATMPLQSSSPARDVVSTGFPATDQRGVSRPQGAAADIGAYEAAVITAPFMFSYTRAGNNLTISFAGQVGGTYRLLYSPDLKVWSPVATNATLTAGTLQFVQPMSSAPVGFYRVVAQ